MRNRDIIPAGISSPIVLLCVLALTPCPAVAQFVPNDRIVSDPALNLPNPEFDKLTNTMVWQDTSGNAWVAKIDPVTGDISPNNGQGKTLDNVAAPASQTGNTLQLSRGGGFTSIVYTRTNAFADSNFSLSIATQDANQVWARQDVANGLNRYRPDGTHANWAGTARMSYSVQIDGQTMLGWRDTDNAGTEVMLPGVLNEGGRWIEGENAVLAIISVGGIKQMAFVDASSPNPTPAQITFESQDVTNPYSWIAPEFNAPVFSAMIGLEQVGVFRKTGPNTWEKFYTFSLPSAFKYVSSPEAFVANGTSYILLIAASSLGAVGLPYEPNGVSQVWIAGIDPANPFFRRIDDPDVRAVKAEPEVFTTAQGPAIYYNQLVAGGTWIVRAADTGLGPDWGYDNQFYSGIWAAPYRDNKNCSCAPFPIGDSYQEVANFPVLQNLQGRRQVMGPEGNLYAPLVYAQNGRRTASVIAYDSATATEAFRVNAADSLSDQVGDGLVASNGDVFLSTNAELARYTNSGSKIWGAALRGLPTDVQYGPDGRLLAFTFNGWFQVFDPDTGGLLHEQNLTPNRRYPETPECLTTGKRTACGFSTAPAVDPRASRVYASYTAVNGNGAVRSYAYDAQTHVIALLWSSEMMAGSIGAPVLSADYSRIYVQSQDGRLYAIDASTGGVIWSFDLMIAGAGTPAVNEFGYILPGMSQPDSSAVNYVGLLKDAGASAAWAFKTTDFSAVSLGAAGRGNRFALIARRATDNAQVLLAIHPKFGVTSQTAVTLGPIPVRWTGVIIDQNGWIFAGTSGPSPYRAFSPIYETAVR